MKFRLPELVVPDTDPFANDVLDRRPVVELLVGLLKRFNGPFVLALDSPWGTGKTTLVRMLKTRMEQEKFQCVYFNAWQSDYVADPLVALVAEVDSIELADSGAKSEFKKHLSKAKQITSAVAKRGLIAAAKAATLGALDLKEDIEAVAAEVAGGLTGDAVEAFQKEKAALVALRQELESAVSQLQAVGKQPSLIFFIDELDRCRPTFAIEVLERIKHLFDLSNIIFVLSIDKAQLSASVASVYGEKSNTQEYLRRFFDLEFGIPKIHPKKYTEVLVNNFGLDEVFAKRTHRDFRYERSHFIDYFSAVADVFQLSLRARERCLTMLAVVLHQTAENQYLDAILVSFLIVLRAKRIELFQGLCDGSLSPETVMAAIAELPGGTQLAGGRPGVIIQSYLLAGDPVADRSEAYYIGLEDLCKSDASDSAARSHAQELLQLRNNILDGFRGRFDYRSVAQKIDLAASFRD